MSVNPDYLLQIEYATLAADGIRKAFKELEIAPNNILVQTMILINAEQFDVEPELIIKALWPNAVIERI